MGQHKKGLIALKAAGLRKGGKPAKPNANVVEVSSAERQTVRGTSVKKYSGHAVIVVKS